MIVGYDLDVWNSYTAFNHLMIRTFFQNTLIAIQINQSNNDNYTYQLLIEIVVQMT